MTVKDLREKLAEFGDDLPVTLGFVGLPLQPITLIALDAGLDGGEQVRDRSVVLGLAVLPGQEEPSGIPLETAEDADRDDAPATPVFPDDQEPDAFQIPDDDDEAQL